MKGFIYYIKNNINNKHYIGATSKLETRIRQHLCKSRYQDDFHKDLHNNPFNYSFGILETITADSISELNTLLSERENHYYQFFKLHTGVYNKVKPSPNALRGTTYDDVRIETQRNAHYGSPHNSKPDYDTINKFINELYDYSNGSANVG